MIQAFSPLTILFATETGSALVLAEFAVAAARSAGISARLADAATYNFDQLSAERLLLVIASTHEGEPPRDAADFFEFLDSGALHLPRLRYAVLALGDTAYDDDFCAAGRLVDQRLAGLAATRLRPRQELDVHEHNIGRAWIVDLLDALAPAIPNPLA